MKYKTITLELLETHPVVTEWLKSSGQFLAALEACSTDLRTRHQSLTDQLSRVHPQAEPEELSHQAFEIALLELEVRIRLAAQPASPLQPEFLIERLRRHTPPE